MYGIGQKVSYVKNEVLIVASITSWSNHSTFEEVYLDNGDIIVDEQIVDYIE
jgi:hypothetical protein